MGGDSDDEDVIYFKHGSEKQQYNLIGVIQSTSDALQLKDEGSSRVQGLPPLSKRKLLNTTGVPEPIEDCFKEEHDLEMTALKQGASGNKKRDMYFQSRSEMWSMDTP